MKTLESGSAYSPDNRMALRAPIDWKNRDLVLTQGYHTALMNAYQSDTAPMHLYDGEYLHDLVMMENARDASLRLAVCSVGANPRRREWTLEKSMRSAILMPERQHDCVLTDDHTHAAAMSIQAKGTPTPTTLSIVVLDSVKPEADSLVRLHKKLLSEIKGLMGDEALKNLRVQVTYLPMGVQYSEEGCDIFALVAAKKAVASRGVKELHRWAHERVETGPPGVSTHPVGADAELLMLEPGFFKHAMKRKTIRRVLETQKLLDLPKDPPVNKKGDTLLERFERYARDVIVEKAAGGSIHTRYSRSYEEKRLEKLAKLIEYKQSLLDP